MYNSIILTVGTTAILSNNIRRWKAEEVSYRWGVCWMLTKFTNGHIFCTSCLY